jgi:hypothetical protein
MLLENPGVDLHARDGSGHTAYSIAVQLDAKAIVECLMDHGASEVDLAHETLHGLQEDDIIKVGLCLARMLRAQVKLVPVILDLAEYWAVSTAERNTPMGVVFIQGSPDEPYISLKINGRSKEPLRRLVFTTTSHDQGACSVFFFFLKLGVMCIQDGLIIIPILGRTEILAPGLMSGMSEGTATDSRIISMARTRNACTEMYGLVTLTSPPSRTGCGHFVAVMC